MNLTPSHIYTLYTPSVCTRRVYLRAKNYSEAEPSPFQKLLDELGLRHEQNHLDTFEKYTDLQDGSIAQRVANTIYSVQNRADAIYQGVLRSVLPGTQETVFGIPDFLIRSGDDYVIRDCKLTRKADDKHHTEILLQLELYGWLYEQTFGQPPAGLEVYLGDESILSLEYRGGNGALSVLQDIRRISLLPEEPFSPVGWTKCGACGFKARCWGMAEEQNDVALIPGIDKDAAQALINVGVNTIEDLLIKYDAETLSNLKKPRGKSMAKIGKTAERILLEAEALRDKKEIQIAPVELPDSTNMVMFDLEGLPPHFDELDKVYLWGMQVYGEDPSEFMPALAGFGTEGDREGWKQFLSYAENIFNQYGDIPFVHWAHYEKTKIKTYLNRYSDPGGIALRVLENCVDLLPVTKNSLVLPVHSYGLKTIEQYIGYKRTMEEFGGDWSIVQYIRAVETEDEGLRQSIMNEILKYNEEDLQATWAVVEWLKSKK